MICPRLVLQVDRFRTSGLLDSGSVVSLKEWKFFTQKNLTLETTDIILNLASASSLKVQGVVRLRVQFEDFVWKYPFNVAEYLPLSDIIEADFMSKTGLVIDLQAQQFSFKLRPEAKIPMWAQIKDTVGKVCASGNPLFQLEGDDEESPQLGHLAEEEQAVIRHLINDFEDVINKKLGLIGVLE